MFNARKLFTAAALALCALAPTVAMAQNVLVLATEDPPGGATDVYSASINNLRTALTASGANVTSAGGNAKVLTTGDISSINFDDYDIAVVATGRRTISTNNLNKLKEQITTNPNLAFIILSDGCSNCVSDSGNALGQFTNIVGSAAGMSSLSYTQNQYTYTNTNPARLNTASAYATHFSSLTSIMADGYGAITGANGDNQIYGTGSSNQLAIFVPTSQMNGGACTFLAGDLSIFKNSFASQHNSVAKTLVDTVQPNSTACKEDAAPPVTPSAQKVLFLSPQETTNNESYIINNIYYDFMQASGGPGGIIDGRGFFTASEGKVYDGTDMLRQSPLPETSLADIINNHGVDVVVVSARHVALSDSDLKDLMAGELAGVDSKGVKVIVITESGQANNAKNYFEPVIKNQILHWSEAQITHLNNSLYSAVPLQSGTYFENNFKGINAGINNGTTYGDEDALRVQTYGVMECIPDKDVIFSYSDKRCVRNNGTTTATDGTYYKARACYIDPDTGTVNNLMEDVVDGSFLSYTRNKTGTQNCNENNTCETFDTASAKNARDNAIEKNGDYKKEVDKLNPNNAAFSFVIPQWQSNHGQGACILFADDANMLDAQGQPLYCKQQGWYTGGGDISGIPPDTASNSCSFYSSSGTHGRYGGKGSDEHAADIFSHVNQRKYVATKYLIAARSPSVCGQDMIAGAGECTQLAAGDICELKPASKNTADADIDINKGGTKCATRGMWCDSNPDHRKDFCASGENPTTHCCKAGGGGGGSGAAPVPTTGWPALLGLGALLPLLARRRQRK